jgi:pimeloyl-ACP methyl ester carboxylesterase
MTAPRRAGDPACGRASKPGYSVGDSSAGLARRVWRRGMTPEEEITTLKAENATLRERASGSWPPLRWSSLNSRSFLPWSDRRFLLLHEGAGEMNTRFVQAPDGARIAYDMSGAGPTLLLLHGLGDRRRMWHDYGYVAALHDAFRVVAIDLRGHGESDAPTDPSAYTPEQIMGDVLAVADTAAPARFFLWGFSFGATIGLHLTVRTTRLARAVLGGTLFGCLFSEEWVNSAVAQFEEIGQLQEAGTLGAQGLPQQVHDRYAQMHPAALIACTRALLAWPGLEPNEVRCPTLMYTGSADTAYEPLQTRRDEMAEAGIAFHSFADLTHRQLVSEGGMVLPVVQAFLQNASPA